VRILNRSSYPTAEVRRIVRRELARSRAGVVRVLDRPRSSDLEGQVRYTDRQMRIWIGAGRGEFPFHHVYAGAPAGWPEWDVNDWREDLVTTAAHESYHLRAHDRGDDDDELAAERHALERLRRYRAGRPSWWARVRAAI
jgi:hypothetical protein